MSLFSSLNVGLQSILANQAALQTTGHNMANATTPGFSRQRVELVNMRPTDMVFAQLGTGVSVGAIRRIVDQSLEGRLADANSSLGNLKVRQDTLSRIESTFNELQDNSISDRLERFFQSLDDLANHPAESSTRSEVLAQAQSVADEINLTGTRLRELRKELNDTVKAQVADLNRMAGEVAQLNDEIRNSENGGNDFGSANDLRDRRDLLVRQIAEVVNVRALETPQGAVNLLIGSNYLVFHKQAYNLQLSTTVDEGVEVSTAYFETTGIIPDLRGGTLKGTFDTRDGVLPAFQRDLDELARAFAFEVNRVHAEGFGLERYSDLTSVYPVAPGSLPVGGAPLATNGRISGTPSTTAITDPALAGYPDGFFVGQDIVMMDGANYGQRRRVVAFEGGTGTLFYDRPFGTSPANRDTFQLTSLPHTLKNGSFDLRIVNELTGRIDTFNIEIDLDNLPAPPPSGDSTLDSVIGEINAETGAVYPPGTITASRTTDGKLRLVSTASNLKIGFGTDSSGFLASIGLHTLFTGNSATTLGLNPELAQNPELVAAGLLPIDGDNANARRLADLRNTKFLDSGTATFEDFYQGLIGDVAVQTREGVDRFEHQSVLTQQIENERERLSGVNLDEEAVNLITYQRAFQASAQFLKVVDDLLATLVNIV